MTKKQNKIPTSPTQLAYGELQQAYDFFNQSLFGDRLPPCLITYQRKNRTYGYFSGDRWLGGQKIADEVAMNPMHFPERSQAEVLSTLVHEMVHLEQYHFGQPNRSGYHNKQWAIWMERVGLIPSDTGEAGGKQTGQQMSHYIAPGGVFDKAFAELTRDGFRLSWTDRAAEGSGIGCRPAHPCYNSIRSVQPFFSGKIHSIIVSLGRLWLGCRYRVGQHADPFNGDAYGIAGR